MGTATLVLLSVVLVVLAGEVVRGQCRRMLTRPALSTRPAERVGSAVASELAA